ncbi:MAG: deoxyribonuclease IV [Muribaculaceae bacterium]
MKFVGAHVSVEGGVSNAPINAKNIGAKSFALFTRNPSRWKSPIIKPKDVDLFKERCHDFGYAPQNILVHDSFLINLGSPDAEKLAVSREAFLDEFNRCELLGLTLLNFHPGSHLNLIDIDKCLDTIAESINIVLDKTTGVTAVIENTAGQGSNLGYSFSQIAHIIDKVEDKSRVGVCIDSCHAFAAGYDLSNKNSYELVWKEFDDLIGRNYLCGMHLNDTKKGLSSKVDRHESIGKGILGADFFKLMMNDSRFDNMPLILETPNPEIWEQEIAWLYEQINL